MGQTFFKPGDIFVNKQKYVNKFNENDKVECLDEFGIIIYKGRFGNLPNFDKKMGIVEIRKSISKDVLVRLKDKKVNRFKFNSDVVFVDFGASFSDSQQRREYQIACK